MTLLLITNSRGNAHNFYHESLGTCIKTNANSFAISSHTALKYMLPGAISSSLVNTRFTPYQTQTLVTQRITVKIA